MIRNISLNPWWAEGLMLEGKTDITGILTASADMGVDGIDMQEIYLGLNPHPDPTAVRSLKDITADKGLSVLSCWFYADVLGLVGITDLPTAIGHITRYLHIAADFSSRYLVLQNGEPAPGISEAQARRTLLAIYTAVAPLAERLGVTICMEAARSASLFNSPRGATELIAEFGSDWITVAPDFEAWRMPNPDLPTQYVENPDMVQPPPLTIDDLRACLPYAPFVHAKFLDFGDNGADPNFPLDELFRVLADDPDPHDVSIEYEGWLPEIYPHKDPETQTRQAVRYVQRWLPAHITSAQ